MLNGIVSHNDWFVTLLAAAGDTDIADRLKAGTDLDGTTFKVHLDGHNQLDYITGAADKSPRQSLLLRLRRRRPDRAALRQLEVRLPRATRNRHAATSGRSRTPSCAFPKLFNLKTDPYERADITSNTYCDWMLDHIWLFIPAQAYVGADDAVACVEFPARQKPPSFSIDQVLDKLKAGAAST